MASTALSLASITTFSTLACSLASSMKRRSRPWATSRSACFLRKATQAATTATADWELNTCLSSRSANHSTSSSAHMRSALLLAGRPGKHLSNSLAASAVCWKKAVARRWT